MANQSGGKEEEEEDRHNSATELRSDMGLLSKSQNMRAERSARRSNILERKTSTPTIFNFLDNDDTSRPSSREIVVTHTESLDSHQKRHEKIMNAYKKLKVESLIRMKLQGQENLNLMQQRQQRLEQLTAELNTKFGLQQPRAELTNKFAGVFDILIPKEESYGFNLKSKGDMQIVYVSKVTVGGPAFHKGVKRGDVVKAVNGVGVSSLTMDEVFDLIRTGTTADVETSTPVASCTLTIARIDVDVEVQAPLDQTKEIVFEATDKDSFGFNMVDDDTDNVHDVTRVTVSWVAPDSPAHIAGLRRDDVVQAINSHTSFDNVVDAFVALRASPDKTKLVVHRTQQEEQEQRQQHEQQEQEQEEQEQQHQQQPTVDEIETQGNEQFELTTSFSETSLTPSNTISLPEAMIILQNVSEENPTEENWHALPNLTPYWDRKQYSRPHVSLQDKCDIKTLLNHQHRDHGNYHFRLHSAINSTKHPMSTQQQANELRLQVLTAIQTIRREDRQQNEILRTGHIGHDELMRADIKTRLDFIPATKDESSQLRALLSQQLDEPKIEAARAKITELETMYHEHTKGHASIGFIRHAWKAVTEDAELVLNELALLLMGFRLGESPTPPLLPSSTSVSTSPIDLSVSLSVSVSPSVSLPIESPYKLSRNKRPTQHHQYRLPRQMSSLSVDTQSQHSSGVMASPIQDSRPVSVIMLQPRQSPDVSIASPC